MGFIIITGGKAQLIPMKEKELFKSKQDSWALYNNFITTIKQHKKVQEKKPKAT